MKDKIFTVTNDIRVVCAIWDNVKKPIGVIQIIHGIHDSIQTYDRFAKFMNKNGYIVFGMCRPQCNKKNNSPCSFDKSVELQSSIMQHLVNKYQLPLFLFGYGYGGIITQSILQTSQIPAAGVCMADTGKYPIFLLNMAIMFSWICGKLFGKYATANILNRIALGRRKLHSGPKCTYDFYLSLFRGIKTIKPYAPFDTPILMICGPHDSFATSPSFCRALYNAYRDNGIMQVTMIVYPDRNDNLFMEMNFGTMPNDILDFLRTAVINN